MRQGLNAPLRHLDRDLEELVKRVCRVLPLVALVQSLATIHLVGAYNAIGVQVRFPLHDRRTVLELYRRSETRRLVRRTDPRDKALPPIRLYNLLFRESLDWTNRPPVEPGTSAHSMVIRIKVQPIGDNPR